MHRTCKLEFKVRSGSPEVRRRPWHLWVVAAFMFALYVGGARDYVLILTGDASYVHSQFGPGGVPYFTDYPLGYRILWTLNIVGGLLAPILLVIRREWASPVAIVCLVPQVLLLILTLAFRDRWNALGAAIGFVDVAITLITGAFAYYCWRMRPNRSR